MSGLIFILCALVMVPLAILAIGKLVEWKFAVRKRKSKTKLSRLHTVASWVQSGDLHKQVKPKMEIDDVSEPVSPILKIEPLPEHFNLGSPDLVVPS